MPNEPDSLSLSHYNECPRLYDMFLSFWGQATVLPRRNHLLHDMITQVFLLSPQYGITVMGFIDACKPIISTVEVSTILGTLVIV